MMKILFHAEQLNYRGTTNSIVDYARYNQEILGNESAIVYDIDSSGIAGVEVGSNPKVIEHIKTLFPVYTYNSVDQLNDIASKFDVCYSQRAGVKVDDATVNGKRIVKPIVTSTKFGVHCVFQYHDPHGDVYAYISEWLSKSVHKNYGIKEEPPFVPYIVDLPQPIWDMRQMLGIPEDKIVIGRLGGLGTFDIEFVKRTVYDIPTIGTGNVYVKIYTDPTGSETISATPNNPVTGSWVKTGVYKASFALNTTASQVFDRWFNSALTTCYYTGSIDIIDYEPSEPAPYQIYVNKITNMKPSYSKDEVARFRIFTINSPYSPLTLKEFK